MTENPFAEKTATLTNEDVDRDEAGSANIFSFEPSNPHAPAEDPQDPFRDEVEGDPSDVPAAPSRRVVKRRIVRQVDLKHVAQDMLGHGIANVLGYWFEDEANRAKLEELGVSREDFAKVLLKQADRAAKALGFEQAWQN